MGVRPPPLPSVRDLLKMYRLRAQKQLSQNFLLEPRVTERIVKAAGKMEGGWVVEVGAGPGSITRPIIQAAPSNVILLEKDKRFLPTLEMLAESSSCPVEIILGDVLSFNMENMFPKEFKKPWADNPPNIHLIGNLPFNIASPLIIKWLRAVSKRENAWAYGRTQMTLTFQKEVAERMIAPVLTKERCRLSVMVQNWCHVELKHIIKGSAFVPKPKVDVGVVHLVPLVNPVIDLPFDMVEKVVRCLFSFRQKYCIKGLSKLFPLEQRDTLVVDLLKDAGIPPTSRPFQLTIPEVGRICFSYASIVSDQPALRDFNHRARRSSVEETLETSVV